ncbi:MAG: DUF1127 domain-containing protein [Variovorax sp.]|nr:DUF1127 domain-containing protein [Variovorax sp.]
MQPPKPALFVAVQEAIRRTLRAQRDQRLLRAMSEAELRDLGIGRSEIPALVSDAEALRNAPCSRAPCAPAAPPAGRR